MPKRSDPVPVHFHMAGGPPFCYVSFPNGDMGNGPVSAQGDRWLHDRSARFFLDAGEDWALWSPDVNVNVIAPASGYRRRAPRARGVTGSRSDSLEPILVDSTLTSARTRVRAYVQRWLCSGGSEYLFG